MQIINKKGQSTVEYVLLVTAVVAVMIAFATKDNTGIRARINNIYTETGNSMGDLTESLTGSHAPANEIKASPDAPLGLDISKDNPTFEPTK